MSPFAHGEWRDERARTLVERAQHFVVVPTPGAKARVWEKVEIARARPKLRFAWPTFALGAACATVVAFLLLPRDRLDSEAIVFSQGGVQKIVHSGESLPTLPGPAVVDLHATGRMVSGGSTVATLERLSKRGAELRLDRGSLLMHVTPRPARAPFLVKTPGFTAKVVGTVLRVVVHEGGRASIAVGHGAVEITPKGGAPIMVRSGERWPADSDDAPLASELERLGTADLEGTTVASFVPAPRTPACWSGGAEERLRCQLELGAGASALVAESALYQAGWIAMRDLHRPARALSIWEKQRARFPRGVLRREVETSIIDALVALRRASRARTEIASYLRSDPDGMRAPEMHFVLGTLYRDADHSCGRARHEFEVALKRPAAPWAERARASRSACGKPR